MNITSIGGRELCGILLGKDSPFVSSNPVELNETVSPNVDISRAAAADSSKFKVSDINEGKSKLVLRDRFERSETINFDLTQPYQKSSEDWYIRANDIDINDKHIQSIINNCIKTSLGSGMAGGIPTKERISEYYGNMAKRLDSAYSDGKLKKDEYDELNKMLEEHMEYSTVCAERNAAFGAIGKERGSLSPAAAKPIILKKLSMSSEEYMAEMDAKVSEYVNKYFRIDRTSLLQLFNSYRYGK